MLVLRLLAAAFWPSTDALDGGNVDVVKFGLECEFSVLVAMDRMESGAPVQLVRIMCGV